MNGVHIIIDQCIL